MRERGRAKRTKQVSFSQMFSRKGKAKTSNKYTTTHKTHKKYVEYHERVRVSSSFSQKYRLAAAVNATSSSISFDVVGIDGIGGARMQNVFRKMGRIAIDTRDELRAKERRIYRLEDGDCVGFIETKR